jgi:hypothetical protein
MNRVLIGMTLGLALLPAAAEPVWLCVGSPEFQKAAAPLAEFRRGQGMRVQMSAGPAAKAVEACRPRPDFILLLGDEVRGAAPKDSGAWHLRAARRPYHGWQASHPAEFVSDMALGDLDADGLPDAPVGRIPAQSAAEVSAAVEKILRWERREPSLSDLTIPVWAGDPGFNGIFRNVALGFFCGQIRQRAPRWAELWILQGDDRSPFCGWPVEQQTLYNTRLGAGGLVSAMIGHGRPGGWWSMDVAGRKLEYEVRDAAQLAGPSPAPPHVIFACATGDFALHDQDCLAEALFRAPGGPVLCVAASEDSHPLTNYYHSTALLAALESAEPRFGELWLRSLRKAHTAHEPDKELLVRALEPVIIKKSLTTADIRADHAMMYNIFGDPATRVAGPRPLQAEIAEQNGQWNWKVPQPPPGARLLVQRRDPLPDFTCGAPASSKEEAVMRLEEANAKLRFHTVAEIAEGGSWSGRTAGSGTLRLVALGSQGLAVAAMESPAGAAPAKGASGNGGN